MAEGLGAIQETRSKARRDPFVHLVVAVVAQAVKELTRRDNLDEVADVVAWVTNPDSSCEYFCEIADVPFDKFREMAMNTDLADE